MPDFDWCVYSTAKRGNSAAEYEDSFAAEPKAGRFAVADGASESSYSGEWADCLTNAFIKTSIFDPDTTWHGWLPPVQDDWVKLVENKPSASWFEDEKRLDGSFATFLGLEFTASRVERTWQAVAVGDACLFQIRNDQLKASFPVRSAADFNSRPALLNSRLRYSAAKPPLEARTAGNFNPGDTFLLMTDALAQWFLDQAEWKNAPWRDLLAFQQSEKPLESFEEWVAEARAGEALKNDDVTLLVVEIPFEID